MSVLHDIIKRNSCLDRTAKESGCMFGLTRVNIDDMVEELTEAMRVQLSRNPLLRVGDIELEIEGELNKLNAKQT